MEGPAEHGPEEQLLALSKELIEGIARWDYETYKRLCAENVTCFQPEAVGTCVEGLGFHKWFFDNFGDSNAAPRNQTLSAPKVWLMMIDECNAKEWISANERIANKL